MPRPQYFALLTGPSNSAWINGLVDICQNGISRFACIFCTALLLERISFCHQRQAQLHSALGAFRAASSFVTMPLNVLRIASLANVLAAGTYQLCCTQYCFWRSCPRWLYSIGLTSSAVFAVPLSLFLCPQCIRTWIVHVLPLV